MKYIDADKLVAEINNRLMSVNLEELGNFGCHRVWAYNDVKDIVTSLQQEQFNKDIGTLIACDIIEMTVKKAIDKPQDKEKEVELMTRKINYLRSLEETAGGRLGERMEILYGVQKR